MKMDTLVILMMAFGIFAVLMFILFYVYAKKYYNKKHLNDDYQDLDDKEEVQEEKKEQVEDGEFVPVKKK